MANDKQKSRPQSGPSAMFVVVGLGNFGTTVALELKRFGNHVIGIDQDERRVSDLAEELDQAMILDARDEEALREAGIQECATGLVAMGENLEASVLSAMNLRLVGVDKVWAKATSRTHHRILSRLGVDRVIHPEVDVGRQIAQALHNPLVRDYVSLGNGYHVVNMRVPEALTSKRISALKLEKYDLRCVGVMRGTKFVGDASADCELQADDLLLVLGRRSDLRSFASSL
ncbi:trk system potassium uptake protein TrkA [Palleronia aestuarii]|uniref:Trk system potassium uptake protein TrkA n=1 Tax=Palleronia aestuarii TaxID=568105 RepID=A0A2W7PR02_9RHOB|nr:TrkA family potassium uptake protein [Palleronia aestuarii]PZX11829.1 trk system potassium uptake protein TrkA [Palleronia aestuarii]